jgi:predicted AlkP superfamily phosphohydrolase/phosphomutase
VSEYLLTKEKWDFFWVVFSETDWLQHLMWRHIDEKHLLHEGENSEKYKQAFKEFWGKIDEVIGQFYRIVGDKVNIIVLSDHGFGLNDQVFKLNAWLEHEGYLLRKKQRRKTLNLIKGGAYMFLKAIAKKITLVRLFPGLYERGRKIISNLSVNVLDEIDLDKSVAFDPGHTIPMGGIYINSCLVTTPQARERLIAEIRAKLKEWGNQHGLKVKTWTFSGESTGPDLLIEINNWRCVMLKDQFEGELFEQRPYSLRHTGSHRMNGIFIANGPDIANIIIEKKIQICDITPTLLYFFNLPIPKIIDGRILKEIFNYEYLKKHSNRWNNDFLQRINQIGGKLTEKEEKALRQKLKDLGYM